MTLSLLFLFIQLLSLVFWGGASWTVLSVLIFFALLAGLILAWNCPRLPFRLWVVVAALIAWDMVCWFQAGNGIYAQKVFWLHMLYLLCFIGGAKVRQGSERVLAFSRAVLIGLGMLVVGFGYWRWGECSENIFSMLQPAEYAGRMSGTFISPNHFAVLAGMMALLLLEYLFHARHKWARILFACGFTMASGGVVLSGSRLALAVFCSTVLLMIVRFRGVLLSSLRPRLIVMCLAAALLIGLIVLPMGGAHRLVHGFWDSGMTTRTIVWQDTLSLVRSKPFTGYGLGNFQWVYPQFRSAGITRKVDFAHSDFLQLWAEGGVVGVALWIAFFVIAMRAGKSKAWACGMVLCVALVDFPLQLPAIGIVLFMLLGMHAGGASEEPGPTMSKSSNIFFKIGATALLGLGFVMTVCSIVSQGYLLAGDRARKSLERDKAIGYFESAARWQSKNPIPWKWMGEVQANRFYFSRKKDNASARKAESCFRHALTIHAADAAVWQELGLLLMEDGRSAEATACLKKALALDPLNGFFHDAMAKILLTQRRYDQARLHLEFALWLYPRDIVAQAMLKKMRLR